MSFIHTIERGDTFKVAGDTWVVLDVDVIILHKSTGKASRRTWVWLSDQTVNLFEKQLTDMLAIINTEDVKYVGNFPANADKIDAFIMNLRK